MLGNDYQTTIFEKLPTDGKVVSYHESDIPAIPGICTIDMRTTFPWLQYELCDPNSGLNKYYNLSTFFDPCFVARKGYVKTGHMLLHKVAAINHAVQSSGNGTIVFWVDTDVTFREPLPRDVVSWLHDRDVTYVPFHLNARMHFNLSVVGDVESEADLLMIRHDRWRVESGTMAITVNSRTQEFTSRALKLYRGDMLKLAQRCFADDPWCLNNVWVSQNVFLNDIFVFALLLQSDLNQDRSFFHVGLKQGCFAVKNLRYGRLTWGKDRAQNFEPVKNSSSMITNFYIGQYIFHHFGYHKKGVLSMTKAVTTNDTWRTITDPGDILKSLEHHLHVHYLGRR